MTATDIDLTKFCGAKENLSGRDYSVPFVRDGWKYFTNGNVCVRVPAADEPNSPGDYPDAAQVFVYDRRLEEPWPDTPCVRGLGKCPTCEGTGFVGRIVCGECGGKGENECPHCGQRAECDECNGKGVIDAGKSCAACNGKKEVEQDLYRRVGDLGVKLNYDRTIRELPGLRWTGNALVSSGHGRCHFTFDGGEGAVVCLIVAK